jgi:hypothetical protein
MIRQWTFVLRATNQIRMCLSAFTKTETLLAALWLGMTVIAVGFIMSPLTPTMLIRLTPKPTRCSFTCGSAGHASARKRHSRTRQYQITHFKQITNDKDAQRKDVVGWFE